MLEVCVDSLDGARLAIESGAQRIELSSCLRVGGLTPSSQLVQEVRSICHLPLIALVRCREGDFHYRDDELQEMLADIRLMMELGCDGVALGACDSDSNLDMHFMEQSLKIARKYLGPTNNFITQKPIAQVVVHRVFDAVPNKLETLDRLVELGFDRVLTSGGKPHAQESVEMLRSLQVHGQGRITILPAGGIQAANAAKILRATGCKQLHGSFTRRTTPNGSEQNVDSATTHSDTGLPIASEVLAVREILNNWLSTRSS
jgi:copper homeostasis protein